MIDLIKKNHLCLGCGLCASVLGHDKCKMEFSSDGFYIPQLLEDIDDSSIKKICPGLRVHANNSGNLWGRYKRIVEGWSCNKDLRFHSSSGGVTSALAIFILQEHLADAVLHVGVSDNNCLHNELKVSKSYDDVFKNAQSRYAPALSLQNLKQYLDKGRETYVYIGKPCDIAGVKNFLEQYPQYNDRFKLFVSIFCAGMPSFEGSKKAYSLSGKVSQPLKLKYRGDGWPGYFKAIWDDGEEFQMSYNESWGKILGRYLNFRCKVCADGIGSLADVSVGDSWCTKDGYPNFDERDGRSLVFVRTKKGNEVINAAESKNYIETHAVKIDDIKYMQPGQYSRRMYAGWRILSTQIFTFGMLDFRGLGIVKNTMKSNYKEGFKNFKGTFMRLMKLRKG